MRNVSANFVENIKTHILSSVTFFFFLENCAVYEKIWGEKNRGTGQAADGNTTGRMHIAAEYLRLQMHT
jgi:hypothetical protein